MRGRVGMVGVALVVAVALSAPSTAARSPRLTGVHVTGIAPTASRSPGTSRTRATPRWSCSSTAGGSPSSARDGSRSRRCGARRSIA